MHLPSITQFILPVFGCQQFTIYSEPLLVMSKPIDYYYKKQRITIRCQRQLVQIYLPYQIVLIIFFQQAQWREGMQKIDKQWFLIKYILLMIFFITYGSILISIREADTYQNDLKGQPKTQQKQKPGEGIIQASRMIQSIGKKHAMMDQQQLPQKAYNQPQHQPSSNFPIAISRTEESIVRDIISTYQDNYKTITRAQEQLPSKTTQAINSAKKQQPTPRTYNTFEDKISQTSKSKSQSIFFHLQLFPFLRPWATTPKPISKLQTIANMFKGIFVSETYLWDDLYEMLDRGGYWQSIGDLLTVATYSKVIDDQFGSLQIFTPTIIRLFFPHDIPSNQTITFTGIRMRYDLHSRIQTRWISQYLGELRVEPTQEERGRREPIQRVFYCEQEECNYLYSLVQLKSSNNVRLHFLQIESIFSVGR